MRLKIFVLLLLAIYPWVTNHATAQDAQQAASPVKSCEELPTLLQRKSCWLVRSDFDCSLLKVATESVDCVLDQLSRRDLPIPEGATVGIPPEIQRLNKSIPDMLPLPGYDPSEVQG